MTWAFGTDESHASHLVTASWSRLTAWLYFLSARPLSVGLTTTSTSSLNAPLTPVYSVARR